MITLAAAFLTFVGFLFAGLLALVITAALDRQIGKERALLLWSGVLLLFTLWQCTPESVSGRGSAKTDPREPPTVVHEVAGNPFVRPPLPKDLERNPFLKHSDTRGLEPITLEQPPWLPLELELPPTIPGPAPGARHLLRGELPTLSPGDGTTIPGIAAPEFRDYQPVVDDVYDAIVDAGRKTYVYIKRIRNGGPWYEEEDPEYHALKWDLVRRAQGWEQIEVEGALIGNESTASQYLSRSDVLKRRGMNVSTVEAGQFDEWLLRKSVDNLEVEILRRHGLKPDLSETQDITALREAARELAEIGRTGKEQQAGWRRAIRLLERALEIARERGVPALRAEILEQLVDAYEALKDEEAMLAALSEYARISPTRPEPWLWIGQLYLDRLALPAEALAYFQAAVERASMSRSAEARLGEGDALTALGRHEEALDAYRRAGSTYEARVRQAEAALRLGRLPQAAAAAEGALAEREGARALLAHGAVLYARGEVEKAKEAFQQAATQAGEEGNTFRAQASYDLGLACWRLGEADAALSAFEACETALRYGGEPARFADETVSPAFGRALLQLAGGNRGEFLAALQEAREEAPEATYHDALAGMMALREGNAAVAARAFESAIRQRAGYADLDGWIARTRLDLARQAVAAGTSPEEAAQDFEAAIAFAERATKNAKERDSRSFRPALRECWIRIHAEHLPARQRFERAKAVADAVLKRIDPEQPGALTLRGYCNYRLAGLDAITEDLTDPYDACIRDFQLVKDKVPPESEGEWASWRDYASRSLDAVKHWRSLEEKTIAFEGTSLPPGWESLEPAGVRARVEEGILHIEGSARRDGSELDPIVAVWSDDLFQLGSLEEVRVLLKVPTRDRAGTSQNIVTFGVEVQRRGGSSRSTGGRAVGIGLYYDRGKIAVRVGGGRDEAYKSGEPRRLVPETEWPSDGWVEIRIVREDEKEGRMALYLDSDPDDGIPPDAPVFEDIVGSFKGTGRSQARLVLGGWSTQAQDFDVEIKEVRVIRRSQ